MAKFSIEKAGGPLVIYVGRQATGCAYELGPLSRKRIKEIFPQTPSAPKVFVGYETKQDFERIHGPLWEHVAIILTGLTPDQIDRLGGIRLYDPITETKWNPVTVNSQ
jgi:hypothetical protein